MWVHQSEQFGFCTSTATMNAALRATELIPHDTELLQSTF
jgi:hypothetical protein